MYGNPTDRSDVSLLSVVVGTCVMALAVIQMGSGKSPAEREIDQARAACIVQGVADFGEGLRDCIGRQLAGH